MWAWNGVGLSFIIPNTQVCSSAPQPALHNHTYIHTTGLILATFKCDHLQSLVADYYSDEDRGKAFGTLYTTGANLRVRTYLCRYLLHFCICACMLRATISPVARVFFCI